MQHYHFFKRDATLSKLRNCGCLSSHLDHFADWMANHQFPDSTAQRHISNVAHFSQSLKGNVLEFQNFDRYVQAFLYRHLPKCKCKGWKQPREIRDISYSLNRFKNYLSDCHGIDLKPRNSVYASIHDEYLLWLSEIQKLENSTIRKQSGYLSQFLRWWKKSSKRKELRELTPYQVESFFIKVTHRRGKAYKQSLQGTLRSFFDFCDDRKYTQRNLRFSIPIIRTYRLSEVPRKIKDSEAVKLLGSIDRSTAGGIRTYAILQILYAYGVRGCQIRALKLKDLEWQKEEIHFPAVKGGKSCSFPLTNEVGNALLDYLGNVRKTSRHQEFF